MAPSSGEPSALRPTTRGSSRREPRVQSAPQWAVRCQQSATERCSDRTTGRIDRGRAGSHEQHQLRGRLVRDALRDRVAVIRDAQHVRSEVGDVVDRPAGAVQTVAQVVETVEASRGRGPERRRGSSAVGGAQHGPNALAPDPERTALIAQQVAMAADDPWLSLLRHRQTGHAGTGEDAHTPAKRQRPGMGRYRIIREPHLGDIRRSSDHATQSIAAGAIRGCRAQAHDHAISRGRATGGPGTGDGPRHGRDGVSLQAADAVHLHDPFHGRVAEPDPRLAPIDPQHPRHRTQPSRAAVRLQPSGSAR